MQFLSIQDGEYTINLAAIAYIDWTEGEDTCTVYLLNGNQFTFEGEDYIKLQNFVNAHDLM